MKKLSSVFFLIVISLSSCVTGIKHLPRNEQFLGFDFTPYSENGFLFTPESYQGDYESIGLITYSVTPEANLVNSYGNGGASTYSSKSMLEWEVEELDANDAIKSMYDKCIEMGADALTNFKVETKETLIPTTHQPMYQYIVSGFAIKRK